MPNAAELFMKLVDKIEPSFAELLGLVSIILEEDVENTLNYYLSTCDLDDSDLNAMERNELEIVKHMIEMLHTDDHGLLREIFEEEVAKSDEIHLNEYKSLFDDLKPLPMDQLKKLNTLIGLSRKVGRVKMGVWDYYAMGYNFNMYPAIVKNILLNALKKGEISEYDVEMVIRFADIRNPKAYLQYLLKKKIVFSYTPSLISSNKVSDCCKASLKIGEPAIAIKDKGEKSIHSLSCPKVKPIYWSY